VAFSAKTKRARGRENRAKISPVMTANNDIPVKISTVCDGMAEMGLRMHVAVPDRSPPDALGLGIKGHRPIMQFG
jgi:hypothetical protein